MSGAAGIGAAGRARPVRGIVLVAIAGVTFAINDALAKTLAREYPSLMITWSRYVFHVAVMLVVLWPQWRSRLVQTRRPGLQVIRGLAMGLSTLFFFASLTAMPLAEASALVAVAPILTVALAVRLLRESPPPGTWLALGLSFAGVLLIIRPGFAVFTPAAMLALACAVCGSVYQLLTRKLAHADAGMATLFIGALVPAVLFTGIVPLVWTTPTHWLHWVGLVCTGLLGAGGHLMLVRGYAHASATTLAPYSYSHAVAALPMGWLVFGNFPDGVALLGMAAIIASGVGMAIGHQRRAARAARAAEAAQAGGRAA